MIESVRYDLRFGSSLARQRFTEFAGRRGLSQSVLFERWLEIENEPLSVLFLEALVESSVAVAYMNGPRKRRSMLCNSN